MPDAPQNTDTDEQIASQVQRGDVQAFGLLIQRFENKLTRYGRRFLFENEDIKDLVQEVFIKAYINIQDFDSARKFSPWIYRIAHNEFINAIKKKSRMPTSPFEPENLPLQPVAPETADGDAGIKELRAALDGALGQIDPKYREPLILYYFEDMDYKQIADVLHSPVSTVGVRLQRGKAMLKKIVGKAGILL
jgi:RNA polymerase sigma-70 factor (ECF subfamily)